MNILKKILLVVSLFFIASPFNRASADEKQMQQLVPDIPYVRKADRTHVFSRAQFIYSLGNNDYLHHWVDRPLLVDPTLDVNKSAVALLSLPSYMLMQKAALKYGLDGFAFFPTTTRRSPLIYDYTTESNLQGFKLLSEFYYPNQRASESEILKAALANAASFRLDGKAVFTSYNTDRSPFEVWREKLAALRQQYGDTFIFLPDLVSLDGLDTRSWQLKYHGNKVTAKDVTAIKEYLRKWLRISDGLYTAYAAGYITNDRNFDSDFYKNFIIRLMKSVLAEPEFQHKYFGLSAVVAHENDSTVGYTLSDDGTKTLRSSMEVALNAHPDLINIPEWDEQNENTSLRPTVYNGYSSMRIMRYYTARLRGKNPVPLPDDDTSIPDLVISYRKTLMLGEKLEVELLNVPDTNKSTFYTVHLILEDANGKTVYISPPQTFTNNTMEDHTLVIPSEDLAEYEVLRPKLEIEAAGYKSTFEDGLHYIELHSTWNWDYKWVKQSIRDILKPEKMEFKVGSPEADGTRMVSANFTADEPLKYVEVLNNDDVVYSYSADDDWRENEKQIIIRLNWQALGDANTGLKLKGNIQLQNATGRWLTAPWKQETSLEGRTLFFGNNGDGRGASVWRRRILLAVPRADMEKASLKIDLPGIYQGTIPLKDIVEKTVYGVPGPKGFNFVLSRYLSQDRMPFNVNKNDVQFNVPVLTSSPNSVWHLQAIGKSGRLYRSKPVVFQSAETAKKSIAVYSDTKHQPIDLILNSGRVPDIQYQFDPSHGSALVADAGRQFWGILGGFFAQVTGRGGGIAGFDTPFLTGKGLLKDVTKTAPDWVKTKDGDYALQFNGKSTFVTLPQGVIPRRAGFTIDMDVNPENVSGKQLIIANQAYYAGSLGVYMEDGAVKAYFGGQHRSYMGLDSGIMLSAGKWSHLTISYDQQTLTVYVDDKPGKPLAVQGPGAFDTASVVGGYGEDWFAGKIKNLRIRHTPVVMK